MRRAILLLFLSVTVSAICITSCTHKPQVQVIPTYGNFPDSVGKIFLAKCTNSGCHNAASYQNAADLELDTWEHLFNGGIYGAEVVAYSTQYSTMLYYINAYDTIADQYVSDPGHMPAPLSLAEYTTIKNWIAAGAPDQNGNIPFATNPTTRQEVCVTVQGSDLLAVIDAKSKQVMRYIPIGDANDLSPHGVAISGDGKYAYVPFFNGNYVQKIDLVADAVISNVNLEAASGVGNDDGYWSIVKLSPLDTAFIVSGWIQNGCLISVNAVTMQINPRLSIDAASGGTANFPLPHGIESNSAFDTFYATLGSGVTKYSFANHHLYQKIIPASGQPHQIQMTPDHSKYFVTCPDPNSPTTNSVRVYDAHTDTLMKVITVGFTPQEMSVSPSKGYIFVACMEDATNPVPNAHGSVYVIDYNTLDTVKVIYGDFYQPHDMTVDEQDGLVFIPSRNANPNGPAPHHTIGGKRPGWYSVYDLNTLLPVDTKRYYLPVDPYAAATRFK